MSLPVSETFFSIQGEGKTIGIPSVFLRLKGCNLTCGGKDTVKTKALDSGATWRCDTIEVWLKGTSYSHSDLLKLFEVNGYLDQFKKGAHLVITGGEPLLHQEGLVEFLSLLKQKIPSLFIECETNATIKPVQSFSLLIDQFNVSPKLANSGMDLEKRCISSVMDSFVNLPQSIFKFVVSNEADVDEVIKTYIQPFSISNDKVYLMPGVSSRSDLERQSSLIASFALEYHFRFSTRLQLAIWDQATGV